MPIDVIMPKLGESITEGTILEWKKNVGDQISKDETLLEISTDKVDSEIPCPAEGKVIEILYKVNDVVAVGEIIARIGGDDDSIVDKNPVIKDEKKIEKDISDNKPEKIEPPDTIENTPVVENIAKENNTKITSFYSPLVKSIAKKEGISLSELESIQGSGANSRVNKNDILTYIKNRTSGSASTGDISSNKYSYALENKIEPMGHMRKMISDHMIKSRDTSVHVYSTSEVDVTKIVEFRNKNKEAYLEKNKTSLTYTPFFIDSLIKAINDFPLINASTDGENIKYNQNINIGVAVALPDNNLIVPVIKRSEELNFLGLARATSDLALRARENNLSPDEAQGSTFTVTNPGVFGSLFGMGIINQPNISLLSVGEIHKRPIVKETEYGDVVVVRSMVYLTLAYDHRVIDGAYGTQFLSKVKQLLETFSTDDIKL